MPPPPFVFIFPPEYGSITPVFSFMLPPLCLFERVFLFFLLDFLVFRFPPLPGGGTVPSLTALLYNIIAWVSIFLCAIVCKEGTFSFLLVTSSIAFCLLSLVIC